MAQRLDNHKFRSGGSSRSSTSANKAAKKPLVLRGTFLHFDGIDSESSLSPRASSDPGSETSGSFFEPERSYVGGLSDLFFESDTSTPSESTGSRATSARWSASESSSSTSFETHVVRGEMTVPELRSHMRARTRNLTADLRYRGHRQALTAIDELPEQVGDALLETATRMVDTVNTDVAVMQHIIKNDEEQVLGQHGQTRQAMLSLKAIPEIIMDSFEASVAKAKGTVRSRVDGVLQECAAMDTQDLVCEMRKIPNQVQAIADQAVHDAVVESKEQAMQQLDNVLLNLTEETAALRNAKLRMLNRIPAVMPETEEVANAVVVGTVEQAVAAVKEQEVSESTVANRVVADTLLRVKAGEKLLRTSSVSDFGFHINPGSIGHPELCPRPCLYHMSGKCSNGQRCDFCHMPHDKRPAHLDKRHREMLKEISFADSVSVALPLLREKIATLGLGPPAVLLLDVLQDHAFRAAAELDEGGSRGAKSVLIGRGTTRLAKTPRNVRMLSVAMKNMSIRALLTTLHRSATVHSPSACQDIYALIHRLRCLSYQIMQDAMVAHMPADNEFMLGLGPDLCRLDESRADEARA